MSLLRQHLKPINNQILFTSGQHKVGDRSAALLPEPHLLYLYLSARLPALLPVLANNKYQRKQYY